MPAGRHGHARRGHDWATETHAHGKREHGTLANETCQLQDGRLLNGRFFAKYGLESSGD
jgi:hypothetical protein